MDFNYEPTQKPQGGKNWGTPFEWGMNLAEIVAVNEPREYDRNGEHDIAFSIEIKGENGQSAKFVSLGYFPKIMTAGDMAFFQDGHKAAIELGILAEERRIAMRSDNKELLDQKTKERDKINESQRDNRFFRLATQMVQLEKLIRACGKAEELEELSKQKGLDQIARMTKMLELTVGAKVYLFLMTKQVERDGRTRTNFSLAHSWWQDIIAYSPDIVEKVEVQREGEIVAGVHVYFKGLDKPKRISKTAKNCIEVQPPNDAGTEAGSAPQEEDDDLPF